MTETQKQLKRERKPTLPSLEHAHGWEGMPIDGLEGKPLGRIAWAAYDRDWVREAPRFRPDESLTALQELELCAHWGIRESHGRGAEVAERDADAVMAVPAEG